jgi:DNA ligase-associated metallophosphoesterase
MNTQTFSLCQTELTAFPSGALLDAAAGVLCVSDLHLGKSNRIARHNGPLLPPYEVRETLDRLSTDIATAQPTTVICLGDSFDDMAGRTSLDDSCTTLLMQMQAGRQWIWIEGNHDPGPLDLGGSHLREVTIGALTYRHIAEPDARGEVSGHYHPKVTLPGTGSARACFAFDEARCILPAYGAYTGGMSVHTPALRGLLASKAQVILTGRRALLAPLAGNAVARSGQQRRGLRGRSG